MAMKPTWLAVMLAFCLPSSGQADHYIGEQACVCHCPGPAANQSMLLPSIFSIQYNQSTALEASPYYPAWKTGMAPNATSAKYWNTTAPVPTPMVNTTSYMTKTLSGTSLSKGPSSFDPAIGVWSTVFEVPAPTPMPERGPSWEDLGESCEHIAFVDYHELWNYTQAHKALTRFRHFFDHNLIINKHDCPECFQMPASKCRSNNTMCRQGLRDEANSAEDGNGRWDTALGVYYGRLRVDRLSCDPGSPNCDAPTCDEDVFATPGDYVAYSRIADFSRMLNNIWFGLGVARDSVSDQAHNLGDFFDPMVDYSEDKYELMMGQALISATLTLVGGGLSTVGAYINEPLMGMVGPILSAAWEIGKTAWMIDFLKATEQDEPDTQGVIGRIVDRFQRSLMAQSTEMFSTGGLGATNNSMAIDMFLDAQHLHSWHMNSTSQGNSTIEWYADYFRRIVIQQTAMQSWENHFEEYHTHHIPFIAMAHGSCRYYERPPIPAGGDGVDFDDVSIEHDGNCYWLLGAVAEPDVIPGLDKCSYVKSLPGGTASQIWARPFPVEMSLADFIVPSIETWKMHNKTNLFADALLQGPAFMQVPSPWTAGLMAIPVCDYETNRQNPGAGCPALSQYVGQGMIFNSNEYKRVIMCNRYGTQKNSNGQLLTYAPGHFQPGTCKVLVKLYHPNQDTDMNPYPDAQLLVEIKDASDNPVGNAGKATIPDAILRIWNSALPHELLIDLSNEPKNVQKQLQFWYGDQHWTENDPVCTDTGINVGREVRCQFSCSPMPKPNAIPATETTPLPSGKPLFSPVPFSRVMNTMTAYRPTPTPELGHELPPDPPRIFSGKPHLCKLQVTQYNRNLVDIPFASCNDIMDHAWPEEEQQFQLHAHLFDWHARKGDEPEGFNEGYWYGSQSNALRLAPVGEWLRVWGLGPGSGETYMRTTGYREGDRLEFRYNVTLPDQEPILKEWSTDNDLCDVSGWNDGHGCRPLDNGWIDCYGSNYQRTVWCDFDCW